MVWDLNRGTTREQSISRKGIGGIQTTNLTISWMSHSSRCTSLKNPKTLCPTKIDCNSGFLVFRLNAFFGIDTHQRFRMCTKIWGSTNDEKWQDNDRHDPKNTGHTTRKTRVTWVTQDDWPWGHDLWILCRGLIKRHWKASSLSRTTDQQIIDGTISLIFAS